MLFIPCGLFGVGSNDFKLQMEIHEGILLLVNSEFTINIEFLNVVAEAIPEASVSLIQVIQ